MIQVVKLGQLPTHQQTRETPSCHVAHGFAVLCLVKSSQHRQLGPSTIPSNNTLTAMVDPFFQSTKKRKRPSREGGHSGPSRLPRTSKDQVQAARDEELSSGDEGGLEAIEDMDFQKDRAPNVLDDAEFVDANETAAEKRVRLARGYLDKVRAEVTAQRETGDYDAEEIDRELIASRLRQEVVRIQ